MPAVEAQQEEEPTTTLQYLTWEQAGWNGPFSIEFPDDCPGQAGLDFTNVLSCWTILPPDGEFPLQQTKRYIDSPWQLAYPIQRSVGFYDAPFWKTSVQVFEHISNSPGSNFFQKLKDESATDSEVLEYLALHHQLECEREYFTGDPETRTTREMLEVMGEEGLSPFLLPREGVRDCVWIKAVDSYIFYTNDNKKMYIVKSAYSIDWWNLPGVTKVSESDGAFFWLNFSVSCDLHIWNDI